MTTIFGFGEMFRPHIENSRLKLPENLDNYNEKKYMHYRVFEILHLGEPIDIEYLEHNANIIADIPDSEIRTVTLEDLESKGFMFASGGYLD